MCDLNPSPHARRLFSRDAQQGHEIRPPADRLVDGLFGALGLGPHVRDVATSGDDGGGVIEGRSTLVAAGVIGNPNIRPETLNETEFGFDAAMLNQRVSMEATYYSRNLTNQLLSPAIAPTSKSAPRYSWAQLKAPTAA